MGIPSFYTQRAIARVESTGVTVSTTNVKYSFRSHPLINSPYNGLLEVYLQSIPAGTTATLPIVFNSGGADMPVVAFGGVPLTAAGITGEGVHLLYYNSVKNVLQFII